MNPPPWMIFVNPAAMMALAILPMPYGYYQFLRLVTVIAAGWIAAYFWTNNRLVWAIPMGFVALLFNPVFRISLEREVWAPLNLVAAIMFIAAMVSSRSRTTEV